jgi:hypothetical protein
LWTSYSNEFYRFELKYPASLMRVPPIVGSAFSRMNSAETIRATDVFQDPDGLYQLGLYPSDGGLNFFTFSHQSAGVSYRFSQELNQWVPLRGERTAVGRPDLIVRPLPAYVSTTAETCPSMHAIVPHPADRMVLAITLTRCLDPELPVSSPGFLDLQQVFSHLLGTIRFTDTDQPTETFDSILTP